MLCAHDIMERSLLGGVGTAPAQLAVHRCKLERTGRYYSKGDVTLPQEARGGGGSVGELSCFSRQAPIFPLLGPRAEAGGMVFLVRMGFRRRFESVEVEDVVPGRIAVLRCRGTMAEQIADALVQGTMKEFFEQTCRELAQTRTPNSQYAVQLITNDFVAVEWDTL